MKYEFNIPAGLKRVNPMIGSLKPHKERSFIAVFEIEGFTDDEVAVALGKYTYSKGIAGFFRYVKEAEVSNGPELYPFIDLPLSMQKKGVKLIIKILPWKKEKSLVQDYIGEVFLRAEAKFGLMKIYPEKNLDESELAA